jgi:hypothetical protein
MADRMAQPRSAGRIVARLLGESFREMAVLVAVFLPLEVALQTERLTVAVLGLILISVVVLFLLGVFLEVKSR